MANELAITIAVTYAKTGSASRSIRQQINRDVSATPIAGGVVSIPTSWTAVDFSGVTSPGYISYQNLDGTNYVEMSVNSGGTNPMVKANPGDVGLFRLDGTVLYMRAHTAACDMDLQIFSN
jgi:hypothetical protein